MTEPHSTSPASSLRRNNINVQFIITQQAHTFIILVTYVGLGETTM
jgi:hypothetical protein